MRRPLFARRSFLAGAAAIVAGRPWEGAMLKAAEGGTGEVSPRCCVVPDAVEGVAIRHSGKEVARWQFDDDSAKPFFYPFNGPSGNSLTRIGHPGTPNHDHQLSVWFAHQDVNGVDFWSLGSQGRIRQKSWLVYEDGSESCIMAVRLGWLDGEGKELMEQTLIAVSRSLADGEHTLELQSSFAGVGKEPVRLGKTNFGLLGVRVAKTISEFFGGGRLTNSAGLTGEPAIFGKPAAWVDYSGPVADGVVEGITYFDHPRNAGSPAGWHVREDGWMLAAPCINEERLIEPGKPMELRYLLHAHRGGVDAAKAEKLLREFGGGLWYDVVPSKKKHRQWELRVR